LKIEKQLSMSAPRNLIAFTFFSIFNFQFSISAPAQPTPSTGHDITNVAPAPPNGAIATPLPEAQQRRLKKYEIPELVGAKQVIGSQLIDGRLPKPVLDYAIRNGAIEQRISFFEGDLVVVSMSGAGGMIRKKLILPPDATKAYMRFAAASALRGIRQDALNQPAPDRLARLRIYENDLPVERVFDPFGSLPKPLGDAVAPLGDLLRAISEDRNVTSSVAGYEPKLGDELVGDDQKTYRVERIIEDSGVVLLRCLTQPTTIYVAKKDLYNYFVGARAQ
jgi:hypothetical protein